MLYVVAGVGPNSLEIPLVIFPSKEEAETFVEQFPKQGSSSTMLDFDFIEVEGIYRDDEDDNGYSEVGKSLYTKLFKNGSYYPGCGGVDSLRILEVEYGTPMVAWDLD